MINIEHTALFGDYDSAISLSVPALGYKLIEDSPSLTTDGRATRSVVVWSPGATTGLRVAQADGERERSAVVTEFARRVGLFLRVDDFHSTYRSVLGHGVESCTEPRNPGTR